jgi:hypothetical protein
MPQVRRTVDDRGLGVASRRRVLALLGAAGVASLVPGKLSSASASTTSGALAGTFTDAAGIVTDLSGDVTLTGLPGLVAISGATATPRPLQVPPSLYDGLDASARLTAWLNALPDGATAQFDPKQDLLCQTWVKVSNKRGLTVRDVGLVRTAPEIPNTIGAHLFFKTCDDLRVEGRYRVRSTNTVAGGALGFGKYNADTELAAALRLDFCAGFRMVAKLDVDGVWGDCIQLEICPDFDIALDPSGSCDRNGRQGITPIGLGGTITGFRLLHGQRTAFDFEPLGSTPTCGDIDVSDYKVRTRLLAFSATGGGEVNNVYIHDGISNGPAPVLRITPPAGMRRHNWRIERHVAQTLSSSALSGVKATRVDGLEVIDCTMPISSNPHVSIDLTECGDVTVSGSNFAPGGSFVRNTAPAPGQVLTVQPDQQVI